MSAGHGVTSVCWTLMDEALDDFKGVYFEICEVRDPPPLCGGPARSGVGDEEEGDSEPEDSEKYRSATAAAATGSGDELRQGPRLPQPTIKPHKMTAGIIFECSGEDIIAKHEGRFGPHRRVLDRVLVIAKVSGAAAGRLPLLLNVPVAVLRYWLVLLLSRLMSIVSSGIVSLRGGGWKSSTAAQRAPQRRSSLLNWPCCSGTPRTFALVPETRYGRNSCALFA
jgi:hypothetical protein